ncbi:MAG: hypothetical protein M1835_008041 [Candelina submexicana]|nr:MAG: hypothetical protein M1835_008041 [Candelina submexicana]
MYPPAHGINLNIDALSGICGSISIACWVVVFSPQIIENLRRGSAEGLSLQFIIVWLAGDVFNILGAVLQGVLPTMVILAVYYTLADIVLLAQCFYYRGFTLTDEHKKPTTAPEDNPTEESPLIERGPTEDARPGSDRTRSASSFRNFLNVDAAHHLSPATPLLDAPQHSEPPATQLLQSTSTLQTFLFNSSAIIMVCAAGVFGWWVSSQSGRQAHQSGGQAQEEQEDTLDFSLWGQIFGYLCAILYLGSRIPQILLNYRRKSTEGVSMLFFLFACIGNLTYVLSIFAYLPICSSRHCRPGEAGAIYGRYILVNASWILGSFGTLLLDLGIFVQFFIYRKRDEEDTAPHEAEIDPTLETGEGRGRSRNER